MIVERVVQLCDGVSAFVYRFDGDLVHLVAHHQSVTSQSLDAFQRVYPAPPSRTSVITQSILDRRVIHVRDFEGDPDLSSASREMAKAAGHRSLLAVPMLQGGAPIGAVAVGRRGPQGGPRPFSAREIALLKTFTDQAVIAVENVRLFKELEARNSDLTETLEQQTATSEILRVISSSPTDVRPVFDAIVGSAVRLCDASFGGVIRFDGEHLHVAAAHNVEPARLEIFCRLFPMRATPDLAIGRAILERNVIHFEDVLQLPSSPVREASRLALGYRAWLAVPMLHDGTPLGVIFCWRPEPRAFTAKQIALVQTFADQAVIAIENVRLFKELEAKNRDLTETLEQQTATSEILRVISASPTNVQPVFDAIARSAVRLCGARIGAVFQFDGELLHLAAHHNFTPEILALIQRLYPMPPGSEQLSGRAILAKAIVQVEDLLADPEYRQEVAVTGGWRSILAVPMLREGSPLGVISINRAEAGAFSERQIALLETFADQAVIAIENVRLFKALEARNRDLTEALEQQTAMAEILRVISSSPTDLQSVMETLARNAARLCEAVDAQIFRIEEGVLRLVALTGAIPQWTVGTPTPISRGWVTGRAVVGLPTGPCP